MKRLSNKWVFVFAVLVAFGIGHRASSQERNEKKVEIKKSMTDEGTSIHLRIEKEDGSIYEKTYASEEEMKNDPELKDLDLHFGKESQFIMQSGDHTDGKLEVIVEGDEGDKKKNVMIFKSDDGELHEAEGDHTLLFNTNEGTSYKILKDENGEIKIEKDGELVEIEELEKDGNTKVNVQEDGTIIITDGDNVSKIKMDNGDNSRGSMYFFDEDGNVSIEMSEEFEWQGDSSHNVFIFEDGQDMDIEKSEDGSYTIKMEVQTEVDDDGNQKVIVHKIVEKIHVEIIDISNLHEISEIPGIHLNEGRDLGLEEVDYYPNPSEGQFTLRFKGKKKPTEVKIIDMMGKEIYREEIADFNGTYDNKINLSGKEPGIYVLQVIQNDKSWSKKLVLE